METIWKLTSLCIGLLYLELCNGLPINLENSMTDSQTQFLTGLIGILLTVCAVVFLVGCACCQRRNGFKEFRDSPVVISTASNLDHGHVNPATNGEFTIFTPLSPPHHNNNIFQASHQNQAAELANENFRTNHWFDKYDIDFPRTKLKYIQELGKGWFGKVVEGAAQGVNGSDDQSWTPVVVRILEATASSREKAIFLDDAVIYLSDPHPNILRLLGKCSDTVPLLLLQEYCPQGDLKSYLIKNRSDDNRLLASKFPLLWCGQLTSALKHLHSNRITHSDLAARNCLLSPDLQLKLGDYGLSISKFPEDYYQGSPGVPIRWCAPESLVYTSTTIQPKEVTTEANIWSLGVTMWEICECGDQPYKELSDDEVISQVLGPPKLRLQRPSFHSIYTDYMYRLMELCFSTFESRPTISQIDLMLSDLLEVYKNTKNAPNASKNIVDDFDKRWETLKPNTIVKTDNQLTETLSLKEDNESDTNSFVNNKQLSPSLNNLLEDTQEVENKKIDEKTEILDEERASKKAFPRVEFKLGPSYKMSRSADFLNTDFDSLNDSMNFVQRTSSESETEDENWKKKIERGAYSEKVRQKSRSVTDLMVLTHIDCSESDSETPLPSLDFRVNFRKKQNLENVSLKFGSEGNLLEVQNTFQEELKKMQEERRDSLLFVPENISSQKELVVNSVNSEDFRNKPSASDQNAFKTLPSAKIFEELNSTSEIKPANQIFNVFNVTVGHKYHYNIKDNLLLKNRHSSCIGNEAKSLDASEEPTAEISVVNGELYQVPKLTEIILKRTDNNLIRDELITCCSDDVQDHSQTFNSTNESSKITELSDDFQVLKLTADSNGSPASSSDPLHHNSKIPNTNDESSKVTEISTEVNKDLHNNSKMLNSRNESARITENLTKVSDDYQVLKLASVSDKSPASSSGYVYNNSTLPNTANESLKITKAVDSTTLNIFENNSFNSTKESLKFTKDLNNVSDESPTNSDCYQDNSKMFKSAKESLNVCESLENEFSDDLQTLKLTSSSNESSTNSRDYLQNNSEIFNSTNKSLKITEVPENLNDSVINTDIIEVLVSDESTTTSSNSKTFYPANQSSEMPESIEEVTEISDKALQVSKHPEVVHCAEKIEISDKSLTICDITKNNEIICIPKVTERNEEKDLKSSGVISDLELPKLADIADNCKPKNGEVIENDCIALSDFEMPKLSYIDDNELVTKEVKKSIEEEALGNISNKLPIISENLGRNLISCNENSQVPKVRKISESTLETDKEEHSDLFNQEKHLENNRNTQFGKGVLDDSSSAKITSSDDFQDPKCTEFIESKLETDEKELSVVTCNLKVPKLMEITEKFIESCREVYDETLINKKCDISLKSTEGENNLSENIESVQGNSALKYVENNEKISPLSEEANKPGIEKSMDKLKFQDQEGTEITENKVAEFADLTNKTPEKEIPKTVDQITEKYTKTQSSETENISEFGESLVKNLENTNLHCNEPSVIEKEAEYAEAINFTVITSVDNKSNENSFDENEENISVSESSTKIVKIEKSSENENNESQFFQVPKLSDLIQNNMELLDYIIAKYDTETLDDISSNQTSLETQKSFEQLKDKSDQTKASEEFLENEKINDTIHQDSVKIEFDTSESQQSIQPNSLTHSLIFASSPFVKKSLPSSLLEDDLTSLNLCENVNEIQEKPFTYSIETWDNFLEKTLDNQNQEECFSSFNSEPRSILFLENDVNDFDGVVIEDVSDKSDAVLNNSLVNSGDNVGEDLNATYVLDKLNSTFVIEGDFEDGPSVEDGIFNVEEKNNSDNTSGNWEAGGGWFLHPQSNDDVSGKLDAPSTSTSTSYVGFSMDDEIMAAIRNELLEKLPHAQGAANEKIQENEEWEGEERNEVFIRYNVYNTPLSPIPEESMSEIYSKQSTPREPQSEDDSDWSEAEERNSPIVLDTFESPVRGFQHRHTPSQDSCCSNDTLFNLEELTCVGNELDKDIDEKIDEIIEESELSSMEKESVLEDKEKVGKKDDCKDVAKESVEKDIVKDCNESVKNESKSIVNTENKVTTEEISHANINKQFIYVTEFLDKERCLSENTQTLLKDSEESSKDSTTSSLLFANKPKLVPPLPSPEKEIPWKQLPISFLTYNEASAINVVNSNNETKEMFGDNVKSSQSVSDVDSIDLTEEEAKDTVELIKKSSCKNVNFDNCTNLTALENKKNIPECISIESKQPEYVNATALENEKNQPEYANINKESLQEYVNVEKNQPEYVNISEKNLPDYVNATVTKNESETEYVNINPDLKYEDVEADYINKFELEGKNCDEDVKKADEDIDFCEAQGDDIEDRCDELSILGDIRFSGPGDSQLMSTSFSESNDLGEEQGWDSGSDTRSSSSGEFIWKEGEHEESVKALHAASFDVSNEGINRMEDINEEETSESSGSDGEGDSPEFVPSAWDKYALPVKSALRSPEKTNKSQKKPKGVWFKKQKYHCVYEYPREPESPTVHSYDLWKSSPGYNSLDWDLEPDQYINQTSNGDENIERFNDIYKLKTLRDYPLVLDDFFVSGSSKPFEMLGGLTSQFFPGQNISEEWNELMKQANDNVTPDSGVEDGTPADEYKSGTCKNVQPLRCLAATAAKKNSQPNESKTCDVLGGLRHTRNRLKLDLPPSPSAFTSSKSFTIEPPTDPVINREPPSFTTFGKSRFHVQHVATPEDQINSKTKNVSFEVLPYKPLPTEFQIVEAEKEKNKVEIVTGEASLLDSADEDSGIESSTLERKKIEIDLTD